MKLIIEDDEGRKTVVPLVRDEISIGRAAGNTIRLTERNVSRRHARLVRTREGVFVEDLGSSTGLRVNGHRVARRTPLKDGDRVEIGDYRLTVEGAQAKAEPDTNPTLPGPGDRTDPNIRAPDLAKTEPNFPPAPRRAAPRAPTPPRRADQTAVIRVDDAQRTTEPHQVRELPAHEQPSLVGLAGATEGDQFVLRRSVVRFGRVVDGNDLVVDHPSVSRQHGRFQRDATGWTLIDHESANGLKVNGEKYGLSPVRPGDVIELGHVRFRFCAPGEAFAATHRDVTKRRSGLAMALGAGVALAALAAGGWAMWVRAPDARHAELCQKGQAAMLRRDWTEAVMHLSIAQQSGATCAFTLDGALAEAKVESDAKAALDEGEALLAQGRHRQAMAAFASVPATSTYDAEARLKASQARLEGVKQLSADVQTALDRQQFDEARTLIEDLAVLDPDAVALPLLRRALDDKRQAAARATPAAAARPAPAVAAAAPAPEKAAARPAQAQPSQEERNQLADEKLNESARLIRSGDINGAIGVLQSVLAARPATSYVAKAHRTLGIAHARLGQTDDALRHYKLYLQHAPDAPDRDKLQQYIDQYEATRAGQ